jgi:N utilization substance protein B
MISRRNIRVKVMQALYALETHEQPLKPGQAQLLLKEKIDQSTELFTFLTYILSQVARYAEIDANSRASKYLPSAEDLNVNTKIAGNSFIWDNILGNNTFNERVKAAKITPADTQDFVKKVYNQLIKTAEYLNYIDEQQREAKKEKAIIQFIFRNLMLENELFIDFMDEQRSNWEDDKEMMIMLMENFLSKPAGYNFLQMVSAEKMEFARTLLSTVQEKDEYCLELITPKLQNWDPERIAAIDMLLLKMGVCEFLYFPTIPTKVTINEYIDLAKMYSTPQSGQFVNGVLDNILKDLVKEDKIRKTERAQN